MRQLFKRGFLVWMGVPLLAILIYSQQSQIINSPIAQIGSQVQEQVLGVADSIENMIFKVNIPAVFTDIATFEKPISAPNLITALKAGDGIKITAGTIPVITNTGILELEAGTGISIDGNKVTSTITQGYTSLTAGTNISVDGNKITNTYTAPAPDYTLSGWTTGTGLVYLSTITDSVGIGTTSPTSALHVVGTSNLAGNVTLGEDSGDTITINAGMLAGSSITPQVDLGADLGTSLKRFNNLYVANINSNSSQAFSGQTTFSYAPTDTTLTQGSVIINPTTSAANGQLLGLSIAGYQRALIDEDGDIVLGYSDATSAPASDYPLNIYGHSGTRVSFTDTTGNAYFAGNVGIGTTGPTAKLHIVGSSDTQQLIVKGNATQTVNLAEWQNSSGTPISGIDSRGIMFSGGSGSTKSIFMGYATGNLTGTGPNNVALGSSALSSYTYGRDNVTFGANVGNHITSGSRNIAASIYSLLNLTTGSDNIALGGYSQRMNYTGSNNISLGFDSLNSMSGSGNIGIGYYAGYLNTGDNNIFLGNSAGKYTLGSNILVVDNADRTDATTEKTNAIIYGTMAATPASQTLVLNANVGIGTTSPTSKLHVSGAVTGKALSIFDETGDQALLTASASGVTKFTVDHSGNVGIGIAPSYALDVKAAGTGVIARFASDNSTLCTLATDGTISCSSDRSLKKNIGDISYGLADVLKLNPVSFNWNFDTDSSRPKSLGFIAQDVEQVIPGLVTIDESGLRSLNTIGMVPVLAKAIQEQQLQIDEITLSTASASITNEEWSTFKTLVETIKNKLTEIETKLSAMAEEIFTKKSHQEELCIGKTGEETCLTKTQIDAVLQNLPTPTATQSGGQASPTPMPSLSPSPSASASADPSPTP